MLYQMILAFHYNPYARVCVCRVCGPLHTSAPSSLITRGWICTLHFGSVWGACRPKQRWWAAIRIFFCHRIHIFDVCLRVSDSISIQFKQNFKWFFVIVAAIVAVVDALDIIKYECYASTSPPKTKKKLMITQIKTETLFPLVAQRGGQCFSRGKKLFQQDFTFVFLKVPLFIVTKAVSIVCQYKVKWT